MVSYRFLSDGDGQTVRMEGCHGAGMDLAYTDGKVTGVTDAMGNTVRFTYTDDRLEGVTVPDGGKMSFTYDDACNLLTITDFAGIPDQPLRHTGKGNGTGYGRQGQELCVL